MLADYDEAPGWPQAPLPVVNVRREQQQKAAAALLALKEQRRQQAEERRRPLHPKCSFCRCEHCREAA
jgi:hypothetical protein